ncbi:hypothetical protein E4T56_gene1563 [Termitomyces sp. T112]|nr:hypothetical protein E4T56_gene1563 [Termitomyces sp. T112]
MSKSSSFEREQLDDTHSNYDRKLKALQPTLYPFLPLANPQTLLRLRPSNVQHLYNHLRTALAHPGPNTCTSINFSYFQVQPLFTSVIIQTSIIQSTIITNPPFQHNSSTNIGAIVGGVVGGVVDLTIHTLLIRRHRRNREIYLFDGNFDPAHVVPTAFRISLPDDGDDGMDRRLGTGVGGVVMPFQYVPEHEGRQEMRTADLGVGAGAGAGAGAAGIGAAYAMSQSQHGHGNGNGYGHGTYTPSMSPSDPGSGSGSAYFPNPFASPVSSLEAGSAYAQNIGAYPTLNAYPVSAGAGAAAQRAASVSSHGTALSNSMSGTKTASAIAKECEAFGGSVRGGMSLANPDSDGAGGSGVGRNGAGRAPIVHRDGGRVV